jgi:hypothetical protein
MAYPFRPMTRKDLMEILDKEMALIPSIERSPHFQETVPPKEQPDLETDHLSSDLKPF